MHIEKIQITLNLGLPEAIMQKHLSCSPSQVGEQLAGAVHDCVEREQMGYYPALDYFKGHADFDETIITHAEQLSWRVCKLMRQEVQGRLGPIFSSLKFKAVHSTAFTLPAVRPKQANALEGLAQHYTPDMVKMELLVSMILRDNDRREDNSQAYVRKMIFRWLGELFDRIEILSTAVITD